jgi:AcrR family transcriptional regulator
MPERLTRQERKTQTRERLLDAAARVFAEKGLEAASLDEVAAAAGYTKGAVYSNFSSKTDLVIALIERRIATQTAMLQTRFEGKDLRGVARDLRVEARMADAERQFLILAIEFWLHAMRDDRARGLVAEQYERAREVVTARLVASGYADAVEPGRLTARDVAIASEALGTGIALQAALDPERVPVDIMARVLSALLVLASGAPAPLADARG